MSQTGRSLSLSQIRSVSTRAARLVVALGLSGGIFKVLADAKDPHGVPCFYVSYFRHGRAHYARYSRSLVKAVELVCNDILQDEGYRDVCHALATAMQEDSLDTAGGETSEPQSLKLSQLHALREMMDQGIHTEQQWLSLAFLVVGGDARGIPSQLVLEAIFDSAKKAVARHQDESHMPDYEMDVSCKKGFVPVDRVDFHCAGYGDSPRTPVDHVQNFAVHPHVPKLSDSFYDNAGPTTGCSSDADREKK